MFDPGNVSLLLSFLPLMKYLYALSSLPFKMTRVITWNVFALSKSRLPVRSVTVECILMLTQVISFALEH